MLLTALIFAFAPATTGVVVEAEPVQLARAAVAYKQCLDSVIDDQFAARSSALNEGAVIAACAAVRRDQLASALAGLENSGSAAEVSRTRVFHKFAALDESVWTIVAHVRARRAGR